MNDSTEQKLNMSLDDLVKKERKRPQDGYQSGVGPQRHRPQQQQGPMANWPWRGGRGGQQQHQPQQGMAPGGGGGGGSHGWQGGRPQQQDNMQPQWRQQGDQWQQQQQGMQQQRGSVFARLGGPPPSDGFYDQQQQQQQYPQQQQPYRQMQNRQQQQPGRFRPQQQQQPQVPPRPVKPKLECTQDEEGNAYLMHDGHCIVQVSPQGDMVLDSGAQHTPQRRAAFNIALSHFNVAIREAPQAPTAVPDAQPGWNVSEGHRLTRFTDGMRIPARGPLTSNRAAVLMAAYGEQSDAAKAAAEAAQEASRKAAIAAGLLPQPAAAAGAAAEGGEGGEDAEAARQRRLKVQGRFMPY